MHQTAAPAVDFSADADLISFLKEDLPPRLLLGVDLLVIAEPQLK
jgi:hypothetical protein